MSTRRIRNLSLALALLALVGLAVTLSARGGAEREIVLHARDMAFYLPGDPRPNPTLRVSPGEEVTFTVVNEEPGMRHDLVVDAFGVTVAPLGLAAGSRGEATFEVPERPGRYPYVCTFHAQMMRGTLEVTAGG